MIIGLNINSIIAKSKIDSVEGNITVNSTPVIEDLEKKDIDDMKDLISIKFSFSSNYEPDAGKVKIEGEVLYKTDDAKNIVKKWKDNKSLDPDLAVDVLNAIFRRCLTKTVDLSADLRLPPPVRFPVVSKEATASKKDDE